MDHDPIEAALQPPALRRFLDLRVEVGRPLEVGAVGAGVRRVIPIVGGAFSADGWGGRVLPGGADFQLVTSERTARLEARYVLETEAGDRLYVVNHAVRTASAEVMGRLMRGEAVDPADVYFRCAPTFETSASALAWIMERAFLGVGVRKPNDVVMRFFEVL